MATIETVSIAQVEPLLDEYGNNMARRDYELPENQRYVEELAQSMRAKGVPDELVTLVRDGDVYRIKAGNSRIEAMKLLGTESFEAIIEEPGERIDRSIIETTVRTNVKKKYEQIEESQFVQQLMMFGDDAYVSEIARIEPEKVAGIRKATDKVGEAATTMSLMHLLAVSEFADDDHAVEELLTCQDDEWEELAEELRVDRARHENHVAIILALDAVDAKITEDRSEISGMKWKFYIRKPKDVPEDMPEGALVYDKGKKHTDRFELYYPQPERDQAEIDAENAENKYLEDLKAAGERVESRMQLWLAERLYAGKIPPFIVKEIEDDECRFTWGIKNFIANTSEKYPIEMPPTPEEAITKYLMRVRRALNVATKYSANRDSANKYVELMNDLMADGYRMDDDDKLLLKRADELVAEARGQRRGKGRRE